jgi:hypothetical protein
MFAHRSSQFVARIGAGAEDDAARQRLFVNRGYNLGDSLSRAGGM